MKSNLLVLNKDNKVEFSPQLLLIKEFKKLWTRDKTRTKTKALEEFAYIYFMADYKSEYNAYGLEKEKQLIEDVFERPYSPDKEVLDCIKKYTELQKTTSMNFINSARESAESIRAYYNSIKWKQGEDNRGFNPDTLLRALEKSDTVIRRLDEWRKKYR